ncbi:MAG: hypothetical protein M1391_05105 [Bacteroidetes bacterium]|nr:hypothetical protein [Bacteroidota bacterium]
MILDIIEEKNNYIKIILVGLIIIWLFLDVIFNQEKSIYAIITFLGVLGVLQIFESFSIRKVGEFNINETYCGLNRNTGLTLRYDYSNIKHILVDQLRYLEGAFPAKSKIVLKISIQEYEKEVTFIVLLRGKKAKVEMTELLKKLYKNKIGVREYDMNGCKSFLFRSNLSYKEIQEIKQEYNISWF